MGSHANHPYHLVNPSPWPLVMAFSAFGLAAGTVMFMHDYPAGHWVMIAAAFAIIYISFRWWRDVIAEGIRDHAHTASVQTGLRFGMGLFIMSEVMFFFAFFWIFFSASLHPIVPIADFEQMWGSVVGAWPPATIEPLETWDLPFLNTLILLLSGTTVTWAHHALLTGNRKGLIQGLALTVLLGASFTSLQAFEYYHAAFGFKDGIYPSVFYMATGFHGAHVLIGTIFLTVNLVRAIKGQLSLEGHLGFEFAAWYWHFVDVVWLFLFAWVYWWGGA